MPQPSSSSYSYYTVLGVFVVVFRNRLSPLKFHHTLLSLVPYARTGILHYLVNTTSIIAPDTILPYSPCSLLQNSLHQPGSTVVYLP